MAEEKKAYFAGGCFWCLEASFESLDGVSDSVSGYMTLEGRKKPTEVAEVHYDPEKITYEKLLEIYWLNIDPCIYGCCRQHTHSSHKSTCSTHLTTRPSHGLCKPAGASYSLSLDH